MSSLLYGGGRQWAWSFLGPTVCSRLGAWALLGLQETTFHWSIRPRPLAIDTGDYLRAIGRQLWLRADQTWVVTQPLRRSRRTVWTTFSCYLILLRKRTYTNGRDCCGRWTNMRSEWLSIYDILLLIRVDESIFLWINDVSLLIMTLKRDYIKFFGVKSLFFINLLFMWRDTWLILPVVICLSQRLSHACLRISPRMVNLRMAH